MSVCNDIISGCLDSQSFFVANFNFLNERIGRTRITISVRILNEAAEKYVAGMLLHVGR